MIYCYRQEDADSDVGNDDTFVTVTVDRNNYYTLERFVEPDDDATEPFGDEEGPRVLSFFVPFLRCGWKIWLLATTVLMFCLSATLRWWTATIIAVIVLGMCLPTIIAVAFVLVCELWSHRERLGRWCRRIESQLKSPSPSHPRRRLRSVGPIDHFVRIVKTVCDVGGVDFVRWASSMCLVLFVLAAMAGVMCLMFPGVVEPTLLDEPSSLHECVMPDTIPSPPTLNSTINITLPSPCPPTLLEPGPPTLNSTINITLPSPCPPTLLEPGPPTLNSTINVTIDEEPTSPPTIAAPSPAGEGPSSTEDVPELVDCPSYLPIIIDTGAAVSVEPSLSFFRGELQPTNNSIVGVGGPVKVHGVGTVAWEIQDATGKVYELRTEAYYVPQSEFRLFSPQVYFKEQPNSTLTVDNTGVSFRPSKGTLLQFPHHKNQPKMLTRSGIYWGCMFYG